MKNYIVIFLCLSSLAFTQTKKNEEVFIPAFPLKPNDLELSRLAQPTQYFDKIGRRAGLMGFESGTFEMWVWPWKPLRNFELTFLLGTSTQPILAKDIVRTISVTPEVTTITYTYEAFTVKQHILIPRNEPGAILLLDVYTTTPLSIIPGFIPVMQPMWPAGIGGQFSYWDDEANGYVISEGQWRAIFLCGSPAGKQMAAPPAHMFADNPLQFRIDVKPGETDGKFIPIVIVGALPDTTTWKMKFDSVKTTYARLWKNAEKYYLENYNYFKDLRQNTMQLTTPDKEINLAYEWGKVALDNLMIENPRLGYGMVAGFGLSGGGARPGFGWFFGGDAFINVLTMNSVGMFQQSRDALAFTQKWQRQDNYPIRKKNPNDPPKDVGKMSHELSQSDGITDWWNDYHYGYNHADTSPWYLVAMGDYVRTSGDIEFLRQSWKSVKQAYEWCLSKDSDGDGLMDLKGAGLGALEFGKLVGIYADVYTCGVFVQGVKEMKYMAELLGDSETANQADAQFKKAQPRLEKLFWLEREGFYAYGATDKGEQVREKTPWSGVAMMFGLLNEERTSKSIEAFNSADLCTDWGVRTLSNKSSLFEPTNYNYGAVWPFISSFFNTAQFKHHFSLSGYQILKANISHVFDHGLGIVPEVFSGELNEKLGEAYHHQGFSTTGYMLPLVRGMSGLEIDAQKKEIILQPHLSTWWQEDGQGWSTSRNSIPLYLAGAMQNTKFSVTFDEQLQQPVSIYSVRFENFGPDTLHIKYNHPFVVGRVIDSITIDKISDYADIKEMLESKNKTVIRQPVIDKSLQDEHLIPIDIVLPPSPQKRSLSEIVIRFHAGPELNPIEWKSTLGENNNGLRFISQKIGDGKFTVTVEGLAGETYRIFLAQSHRPVKSVVGGEMTGSSIRVTFPKDPMQKFVRKEIIIELKP